MPHKQVLEQICEGCKTDYCTLKEILLHTGLSDRQVIQIKCIEKFKYEESASAGEDIGWQQANLLWVEKGFAAKFEKVYTEGRTYKEIYQELKA